MWSEFIRPEYCPRLCAWFCNIISFVHCWYDYCYYHTVTTTTAITTTSTTTITTTTAATTTTARQLQILHCLFRIFYSMNATFQRLHLSFSYSSVASCFGVLYFRAVTVTNESLKHRFLRINVLFRSDAGQCQISRSLLY